MIVTLTLGPVIFQDFEIPESLRGGGSQSLDIKRFLGGTRVIDAMGGDDDPIEWSGRFRGSTAESRCQQLNGMRDAGRVLTLTWSGFSYQVLIGKFTFDYMSPMEINYRISLEVLVDNTLPIANIFQTLESVFGGNLADSLGISDTLNAIKSDIGDAADSLGITDAVSTVSSTFSDIKSTIDENIPEITSALNTLQTTASTFQSLTGVNVGPLLSDISSAQGVTQTAIVALNGQIAPLAGSIFGSISGLPPQTIAANLAGQASAFASLGNLLPLNDILNVMGKNVASSNSITWNPPVVGPPSPPISVQ